MSYFEQRGISMQYDAISLEDANKKFQRSCDCCCHKGRNVPCDKCHIAEAHSLVVAYFNDKEAN